jgi:hypothetical protein
MPERYEAKMQKRLLKRTQQPPQKSGGFARWWRGKNRE